MKTPDSELRSLTDAWHDGTITPEDGLRLEKRLLLDSAAREYFFATTAIEVAIPGALRQAPQVRKPARAATAPRGAWWRMAAVFLIGGAFGALLMRSAASRPPVAQAPVAHEEAQEEAQALATITGMLGVTWEDHQGGGLAFTPAMPEARIRSGLLELTFASGTRAIIEGPAAFQVRGNNSIHLNTGKLVAEVPKGAEGFTVDCREGTLVDLGTEFGVEVTDGGRGANFGVFRGKIEFHPHGGAQPVCLLENHAVATAGGSITSVPFVQEKFTRRLPSREFAWKRSGTDQEAVTWDYDISHLVWSAGDYRVICKWMQGRHGIWVDGVELLRDDISVARDIHAGSTGDLDQTYDNCYHLTVPADAYRRGRWVLRVTSRISLEPGESADTAGVILVEDGIALRATAADFVGAWEYFHDGSTYRRIFHADGTAALWINGTESSDFTDATWSVTDGTLVLRVTRSNGAPATEYHHLRDPDTLVFGNRPYRDAKRIAN